MSTGQFRQWIKEYGFGKLPREALDRAVEDYKKKGKANRDRVAECVEYARGLAASQGGNETIGNVTPAAIVVSNQLTQAVEPEVVRIREEIFRKRTAPFNSLSDAARWIGETGRQEPKPSARDQKRAKVIESEVMARRRDLKRLLRTDVVFEYRKTVLAHISPSEGCVVVAPAAPGSPLARLAGVAQDISKATGFAEAAIVAFVTVGIPPFLPIARISSHTVFPGQGAIVGVPTSWVTVTVFARDLTFEQLRQIYRKIREATGLRGRKRINARHQVLIETVRKLGGAPRRGSRTWGQVTEFWEEVRAQVNREYPKDLFPSWRAARMMYRRLA